MYKKYIYNLYLHRLNICYSGETGRKVSCFYLVNKIFLKKSWATLLRAPARPRSPRLPWPPRSGKRGAASKASPARLPDDVSQGSDED